MKTPAYVTAFHNGVLVQNHFELKGETLYIGKPGYKKLRRRADQAAGARRSEPADQLPEYLGLASCRNREKAGLEDPAYNDRGSRDSALRVVVPWDEGRSKALAIDDGDGAGGGHPLDEVGCATRARRRPP